MRESWPHAPPHYFTPRGIYMITAATLHRKPLFDSRAKLDLLRDTTFETGEKLRTHSTGVGFLPQSLSSGDQLRKHHDGASQFRAKFAPRTGDGAQPH